jgi:beta-glucanase (GH16 family)
MAFANLKSPATFFKVGRSYRMQVYVRDVNASGRRIGLLLANENFGHRPTDVDRYESFADDSWHLMTRTFVCTEPAFADTGLYLDLPPAGELHWQVTAASVREIATPRPPRVAGPATQTLSFDGAAGTPPDPLKWNHEVGGHGWGNGELQTYTESKANAQIDGAGNLRITALRQESTGPDRIRREYTSARLNTKGKVDIKPGSYVEATLRAPGGAGVWPAFWLLGTNISEVGWPACGELDVVEVVGSRPTVAHSMIHMATVSDLRKDRAYPLDPTKGMVDLGHPLDSQAHRYGVYFDNKMVRFYIDRKEHLALGSADALASNRTWPFGNPQYLVLNIAVGGKGDPSRTEFPKSMIVHGISIWEGGTPF